MTIASSSLRSESATPEAAAHDFMRQLGDFVPRTLVFFHAIDFDGASFRALMTKHLPDTETIGCSTCGHFTDAGPIKTGVTAIALGASVVRRCKSALARTEHGVKAGVMKAVDQLAAAFGKNLRDLDGSRYVGIVLVASTKMRDEGINAALGDAAPFLSFVGGSAGDDFAFQQVWTHAAGESTDDGAALLLLELENPGVVLKTCNYTPTERSFIITKADPETRMIFELDGQPALQVYAEAVGHDPATIGIPQFLFNPLGLMIDGNPWLRSVFRSFPESGALMTACEVLPGMQMHLMRNEDIVERTRSALESAYANLGETPKAALLFNCGYRFLETQALGTIEPYHALLSGYPLAGFHTHGESWLGHMNQTLVGLLLR